MYLQTVSHRKHHGYPHTLLLGYLEISQDSCHIDQNLALFHDLLVCHIDQNLALFHNLLVCLAKYLPHEHVKIPNAQTQFGWVNITVKIKHITP